ncbi:restriction endonuclease [Streptomyces sp. NPDC056632]|uniref:restriction endonuclease n=1 Tax=Streptomyces sp. NPDC056632 TaxID=3345884 RepID=UPI00369C6486
MAASGERERGIPGGRPVALGRDVALAVGLAAAIVGGAALFLRTARASGVHTPVVLVVLLLVLGVGVAMARWSIAPVRSRRVRPPGDAGEGGDGRWSAPVEGVPAEAPVVDGEALDHFGADPDGFEHTVAALCVRDGCSAVEVVGGAGDLGADVLATTADGRRVVLQCKQYAQDHRVGSPDLQRFGGTCYTVHHADVAILVTTSSFTDPALEYAASCGILCVDGTALDAWTASASPAPWDALPLEPDAGGGGRRGAWGGGGGGGRAGGRWPGPGQG